MLGPSGFFMADGPEDSPLSSTSLELIHTSGSGFNVLYRGCKNGRFFIYKGLKPEYIGNTIYEDLLKKDFDIGFSLTHSGICQYYAMIKHPDKGNCIVMEWIDGSTLEELISSRSIDKHLARKIILEICDALEYMHSKQVIHRDLKPENILVTHNGKNVKIIDFGLSDTDSYNRFKAPAGTRMYASPEQKTGGLIDNRCDLWALGMIMNEMTGKYGHVAGKCLRRDMEKRYRTAAEVRNAVLRDGSRKAGVWFAVLLFCAAVAVAAASFLFHDTSVDVPVHDAEVNASYAPTEDSEVAPAAPSSSEALVVPPPPPPSPQMQKEQRPAPSAPAKSAPDPIDETSLDELFNEAALQLL